MKNQWNEAEAGACPTELDLRVYSSRLIGREPSLVLHGGGNTSVKAQVKDFFGEEESVLFVKGSGWDLATIQPQGFSPVRMETLLKLAQKEHLTDTDMVRVQMAAMTDPSAPAASVEAILHAIIPFPYVDHTHADAVVALSNTPDGEAFIRKTFGERVFLIPYVMPGFVLARKVFELTRDTDWSRYDGMILMNHGIFTFGATARESYDRMIELVSLAEEAIQKSGQWIAPARESSIKWSPLSLAKLRKHVGEKWGAPVLAELHTTMEAKSFASHPKLATLATQGPLTPDHVIHTKRLPLLVDSETAGESAVIQEFEEQYRAYYKRHASSHHKPLDAAPRWGIWKGVGTLAFGANPKRLQVVSDIARHTVKSIQWADSLGGWKALPEKDIFDVEYWELEQAKLKKNQKAPTSFEGKVALITGAASGIGMACANELIAQGAAVVAVDRDPQVEKIFAGEKSLGLVCDLTQPDQIQQLLERAVQRWGGIDLVVSNAGTFPPGKNIESLPIETWKQAVEVNLSSHFYLLHYVLPYLENGFEPAVVVMGSKNVPAPGPGASAYSSSKAGLTQLARVAALEWAPKGIRVNVLHPNAVFDTAIWTDEVLTNRAAHYGMTVEAYKKNNLLHVEVTSKHVASLACQLLGPSFSRTTGAQVAIDGGNDRVI